MNERDISALNKKERALFSNAYTPEEGTTHGGGAYNTAGIPHAWADSSVSMSSDAQASKSFGLLFLLVALVVLLCALLFTGWMFINKKNIVSNASIETLLTLKPFVEGGENTEVGYSIQNKNTLPLLDATFTVTYDKGTGAQDEQNKKIEKIVLGTIAPGELKKGDIQVQLYGSENTSRDITGRLEYKVTGSNAVFSKSVVTTTLLKTPPVSVHIESEGVISPEEPYSITIRIKNTTNNVMDPTTVSLTIPTSYVVKKYSEKPINKTPAWTFDTLAPGEEKIITLDGTFKGASGETLNIKAVVGSSAGQIGTIANVYSSDSKDVTLSSPNLSVMVSLTQETGDISATTVLPGSRVRGILTYENKSSVSLSISSLVVKILGNKFDPTSVSVDNGLFNSEDNTITWGGSYNDALKEITPGERGSLIFTFAIRPDATTDTPIVLDVKGTATTLDLSKTFTSRDNKSWFIQGGAQIVGTVAYKDSVIPNTGPIPPVVNQITTYTITLNVQSDTTLKNGVASLKIPPYVNWKAVVADNAPVTYNDRNRTITWQVGTLDKNERKGVSFQVAVRPSLTHLNTSPAITSGIVFEGVNTTSGETIKDNGNQLSTYLSKETLKKDISNVVAAP